MGKVKVGTASGKGRPNWIARIIGLAIFLFIVFMLLGAFKWENRTGLAHLDRAMETTWFSDTHAMIMGKAEQGIEDGLDKGNDVMMDAYGKGKKKVNEEADKARDFLDDVDREHLEKIIDEKSN